MVGDDKGLAPGRGDREICVELCTAPYASLRTHEADLAHRRERTWHAQSESARSSNQIACELYLALIG